MRRILLSAVLAAAAALTVLPAHAQQARDPAIESTIQNQFDAFLKDDVGTAFSFASPNIKGLFGTPENFGPMVRNGYPMVWRPVRRDSIWNCARLPDNSGNGSW